MQDSGSLLFIESKLFLLNIEDSDPTTLIG